MFYIFSSVWTITAVWPIPLFSLICSLLLKDLSFYYPLLYDYKFNHLLYANDLLLLSTSSAGLQKNIDMIHNFCHHLGLMINSEKKIMVFSKGVEKKNIGDKFKYVVNNSELEYVTSYK